VILTAAARPAALPIARTLPRAIGGRQVHSGACESTARSSSAPSSPSRAEAPRHRRPLPARPPPRRRVVAPPGRGGRSQVGDRTKCPVSGDEFIVKDDSRTPSTMARRIFLLP